MSEEGSPYKTFEIKLGNDECIETETVSRITFQEAVRDAYILVAKSRFSKKILCVRALD